jgi:hypothetical protein
MNTPNIYQEGNNEIIRSDYEKYLESLNKEELQKIIDYLNNKERNGGISIGENTVFEKAKATFIIKSNNGGRRRSIKSSKKHPTARRHRRSSKARKARKARATRRN